MLTDLEGGEASRTLTVVATQRESLFDTFFLNASSFISKCINCKPP